MIYNCHSLSRLQLHLVCVTKFRKNFDFAGFTETNMGVFASQLCKKAHCRLINIGIANNHLHFMIEIDVNWKISKVVEIIKTVSSKYWKKTAGLEWPFWQTGYFICSVGNNSISKLNKYLQNQ